MAQHDYNLANQSGADFRADLNNALSAIVTVNSGASAPSTTFAHQLWVDTSSNVLKIRNAANDAWVTTGLSITADNTFTGNITGNAATATALATARTINGASFDGTANISFGTDSVSEGSSNLYFTNARVESYLDTGTSTPTFASAVINTSITGSAILDDDSFGTASATTVATSESIKAYVDSQIGSVDTLAEILLNGNTTGGTDIAFGDNDKAIFGTGSDLQIYHDSSNSIIKDAGAGNLELHATNLIFKNSAGDSQYASFFNGGAVTLRYAGAPKIATTSSGIDVTGTVTSDGLTVDGEGRIEETGNAARLVVARTDNANATESASMDLLESNGGGSFGTASNYGFRLDIDGSANTFNIKSGVQTSVTKRFQIGRDTGDISFYDDTGSTQGLFWDASAESLGIGTSSPVKFLDVGANINATAIDANIRLNTHYGTQNTARGGIQMFDGSGVTGQIDTRYDGNKVNMHFGSLYSGGYNTTSRMVITGDGKVGIGTDSPGEKLTVSGNTLTYGSTGNVGAGASYFLGNSQNSRDIALTRVGSATLAIGYYSGGWQESARFDNGGQLLIGKTASDNTTVGTRISNGFISSVVDGDNAILLNRLTSDGSIVLFRKDGSTVGNISSYSSGLDIAGSSYGVRFAGSTIFPVTSAGSVADNVVDLGYSGGRFQDIYATNGTIQTSDINEKQDIEDLSEAETRVAVAAKGLLKKYRWKSAVEDKGDDARIHFGIMAQDLQQAFSAEGLDAGDYGMFISSTWTDETTGEEKTRLGVRYNELLAFIIAAI